jgi:tetratricopeptide (TPR) repeat protein
MSIKKLGARLSHAFVSTMERMHLTQRSLFSKDGWGPALNVANYPMIKYRGPLYPAPLHPSAAVSTNTAKLCNDARRAWAVRNFANAESLYRKALQREPQKPDILFELAQLLWLLHRVDEAQELLERAKGLDPNHYQTRVSLIAMNAGTNRKAFGHLVAEFPYLRPPPPDYIFEQALHYVATGGWP